MELNALPEFLCDLAQASAAVILPYFNDPQRQQLEWKADQTPVTRADREAEALLRQRIRAKFPEHAIIGEEFGAAEDDHEFTWILDPIDGTRAFAAGCPLFGTLICLCRNGAPLWGAIHLPVLQRLYIGDGRQAWLNGKLLRLPEPPPMAKAFLCTTDPKSPPLERSASGWQALLDATDQYRSWGDCFGYTLLMTGGVHIMTDPMMNIWDTAALLPVLRGAGAAACDWHGNDPMQGDSMVSAHPKIMPEVLRLLNPTT